MRFNIIYTLRVNVNDENLFGSPPTMAFHDTIASLRINSLWDF